MGNFWDFNSWGFFNLIAVLLASLLIANMLRRSIPWLEASLIPTSVLGGGMLLSVSAVYNLIFKQNMFEAQFFGGTGTALLEIITYHCLALGFIASTFKSSDAKLSKQRTTEIFNTGVTTVSTYLIQAIVGFGITILCSFILEDFFPAAGVLLPFGYGQGTGQALNYGNIYEMDFGFEGGRSFGLVIAALGFLSASIGGVIHLNVLKKRGQITTAAKRAEGALQSEEIQAHNEIPMNGSMDKMTVQVAIVCFAYFLTYLLMLLLAKLVPGMTSVIFGFNFLIGVLVATLMRTVLKFLNNKKIIKRRYTNNFLMTRTSNFFFDLMVVAGIAAIRLSILEQYWGIMLILGVVGAFITYFYLRLVTKPLIKGYTEEQFLAMYGMLTGTASTGIILLREVDDEFKTPVADNLVYQNFPAIVFGFPIMLLATLAPQKPYLTLILLAAFFLVMNIILFRSFIFKKKAK